MRHVRTMCRCSTEDDPIIRSVDENKEVDKDVGEADTASILSAPVEATDPDTADDTLTYTIVRT